MPRNADKQRCGALTAAGQPCASWARRHSNPPRCTMHAPRAMPHHGRRRCTALTASGARCRKWTLRGAERCSVHSGLPRLPPPATAPHRPCSALTAAGEPCARWAVRGSLAQYGRRLCPAHLPAGDPRRAGRRSTAPPRRRCIAVNSQGRRCGNYIRAADDGSRLCWNHANPNTRLSHGYYRTIPYFTAAQQAYIARQAREGRPLAAELLITRLQLRGLLAYLSRSDLTPARRIAATELALQAVRTVTRLLHARKNLTTVDWTPRSSGGGGLLLERILENDPSPPDWTRRLPTPGQKSTEE